MAGRGLEKVFDYLVSPEEQSEAQRRTRDRSEDGPPPAPVRWCIGASSDRPLACALAVDLAVALARSGCPTRILAGFERPVLLARTRDVPWLVFDPGGESQSLFRELARLPEAASALVIIPPGELAATLGTLPRGAVEGVLLPVDAAPWGLPQALTRLRPLGRDASWLRIGTILLGARGGDQAMALFRQLERAARQQLHLAVERLGELQRDAASFGSLLRGVSVLDFDADAPSSRQVLALSRSLRPGASSTIR